MELKQKRREMKWRPTTIRGKRMTETEMQTEMMQEG